MKSLKRSLVLAALLSGCSVLGPDYHRPTSGVPAQYTEAADKQTAALNREWWKLFRDPTLDDLVAQALAGNADLSLAAARVEEADAVLRQTGAVLFPEVDLGASDVHSRSSTTVALPASPAVQQKLHLGLGTSFELDFWGKLRRASESARASALASRYGRDTLALTLAALVTQSYVGLRSLDAQVKVAKATLESRASALSIVQVRLASGLSSELDLRQAEGAQAAAAAQWVDLVQQRALAEHQLALLVGRMDLKLAAGELEPLPLPPRPPAGLPSTLLEARPDIRQAEAQLVAANARIGVSRAALFPSISLTGLLGGESAQLAGLLNSPSRIWSLGLGLNLPLFDAGRLDAQVDQATALQKQALAAYQKAIQSAFKEVNDALIVLRQGAEKDTQLDAQVTAAARVQKLAQARYQAGYSPYLEVLDSQRTLNDATLSLLRNRQARLAATVDLFRALGGGWQEER